MTYLIENIVLSFQKFYICTADMVLKKVQKQTVAQQRVLNKTKRIEAYCKGSKLKFQ